MKNIGLIPCRMESVRLPNKPLKMIGVYPMFAHVYFRSRLSNLDDVYVCTDSKEIIEYAESLSIPCILTGGHHLNGTERCAEAAEILSLEDDINIIDIQGDEALVDPSHIDLLINNFIEKPCDIMVPYLKYRIKNNINVVKILAGPDDKVIYMSRSDIPNCFRHDEVMKKHLDIIAFTKKSLIEFSMLKPTHFEKIEGIELLRAVEHGMNVKTTEFHGETRSVNTYDDLEFVRNKMPDDAIYELYVKDLE